MTKHRAFYHLLARHKKKRKQLIRNANIHQLNTIRNFCHRLCKGKVQLKGSQKRKLLRYRKLVRDLANRSKYKTSKSLKRRIMTGGFLNAILPALLPTILGLVSSVGGKAIEKAVGI